MFLGSGIELVCNLYQFGVQIRGIRRIRGGIRVIRRIRRRIKPQGGALGG